MTNTKIRTAQHADLTAIVDVALSSSLFSLDEAPIVQSMLEEHFASTPPGHHWLVAEGDDIIGAAYVAPEAMADGVCNLYFIAVSNPSQRQGIGGLLLNEIERLVSRARARILLIETSSAPEQAAARAFYEGRGYDRQGRIINYYQVGEDKIIFARHLTNGVD